MDELINEIHQKLLNEISNDYDKSEGYLVSDMLKSVSFVFADLTSKLDSVEQLIDVDKLTGDLLAKFVSQRKGVERTLATFSRGVATVTGNGTIETGDLFETKNGVQFMSLETKQILNVGDIKIICLVPGAVGNIPANQIVQMPVTLSGITTVTNKEATAGGYEEELDDSLRDRYYVATRTPPTSGNVYHYLQWAKEVSGVGDVKVFPLARGDNTVEVVIIDQQKKVADGTLINQVQKHIDPNSEGLGNGEAPIGARCYVLSAEALEITISSTVMKVTGVEDSLVLQSIKESVSNYLKDIAFVTNYVSYAKIGEAIINAEGVEDYADLIVNGSNVNIIVEEKQVAILGGVTIV